MGKKDKKVIAGRGNNTEGGTSVKTEQGQPTQQLTEDQAFMAYMNNLMNSVILEQENAKTMSIEALKNIGQKLNLYIREVSKLTKENESLRKQIEEIKKK